jgi:rod shape-determining protein MreC
MQPYIWLVGEEKRLVTGIQQVVENVLGLFRETSQLRRENHELHLKLGEFTLLQQENEELRNLLQLTVDSKSENYTPKRLQLLSRSGVVQRINIDFSEKDVWREQDVVVDKIGNFVGRVVNVRKNRAEILLVSDYMSKIPALLASSGRRVILAGNGDEFLDMAYFFNNDQVALEGESVYTSSDGDILPAGIPIGQVVVRKSKFLVKINASLSSLNWVLVRHKSVPTGP